MATPRQTSDPAQVDRVWFGYHPRAMAPTVAVVALVSLFVWPGRYLDDLSDLARRAGALAVFAVAWGAWPALGAVFLYRTVTYTYRLTDRAIVVDFGFWFRSVPPIALIEVVEVRAGARILGRVLGVGWVEVRTVAQTVRLVGVRNPGVVAAQIRGMVTVRRDHAAE